MNEILYSKILNFIAYKPRTVSEVVRKFDSVYESLQKTDAKLEEQDKERSSLLSELQPLGLLNDLEYAKTYIKEKSVGTKSMSKRFIETFLLKKGVNKEAIKEAFKDTLFNDDLEKEAAERLLTKKLKSLQGRPAKEIKRKITQYLLSKGFSSGIVFPLVDTKTNFP